jgi:hypothetical protein
MAPKGVPKTAVWASRVRLIGTADYLPFVAATISRNAGTRHCSLARRADSDWIAAVLPQLDQTDVFACFGRDQTRLNCIQGATGIPRGNGGTVHSATGRMPEVHPVHCRARCQICLTPPESAC